MSKEQPGFWLPPNGKPEGDVGLEGLSSLERIKRATSPAAVQIAASKAQAFGTDFGNSGVFGQISQQTQGYPGGFQPQAQQAPPPANFDSIQDDYNYRIASALYNAGQPDDQIQWDDGSVSELYTRDMAILHVRAGRQMDHVDIETFASVRELDARWQSM
jgi:hypothetical protein